VEAKADKLNEYEFFFGEPDSFKRVLDTYRKATVNGIRDASRKTFDPNSRLILRVVPEPAKADGNPRGDRPVLAASSAFQPQLPTEFKLSNGIKVSYWNRPELPLMTVAAQFKGGADQNAASKAGLAELTADMLTQGGAGSLDAKGFSKALELLGAQFSASAGHIVSNAEISSTAISFDQSLALFADAIGKPKFDAKDWERVQRLTAVNLEQEDDNPSALASKISNREFWGSDHPYGRPVSGTPESVRHITVEDLTSDWTRIFRPERTTLFVAGSLPAASVQASLERALGTWRAAGSESAVDTTYAAPANQKLRVVVVDKPGAVQTVVRFTFPAVSAGDPSKMKLYALSLILGGTFTSRLNQNLREDKGYTYGAGSRFTLLPSLGYLTASADVRADVTGASVKEFLSEFAKIRKGDVTDAEASKAASSLRTETIQSLAGLQGVISKAMSLHTLGLPFSAITSELGQLEVLKANDLNSLVNSSIPLEMALLVLVGDKAQILKQLEGLGLPQAEVIKP
jgi:predicted Zn-dependent peptidase